MAQGGRLSSMRWNKMVFVALAILLVVMTIEVAAVRKSYQVKLDPCSQNTCYTFGNVRYGSKLKAWSCVWPDNTCGMVYEE